MTYTVPDRVRKALLQYVRKAGNSSADVGSALERLGAILALCGEASYARVVATRIGMHLLEGNTSVIVPVCPDYSHEDGMYTFRGLGNGVSLLTQKHIVFLRGLQKLLPELHPIILLADLEAEDEALCRAVGVSREEFTGCLSETLVATRKAVTSYGWEVCPMTEVIPDLRDREAGEAKWISSAPGFVQRIKTETASRMSMYRMISPSASVPEMMMRTVRTAAQYVALGRFAKERRMLICNHTTVNLSWYLQADATVLHNPVSVY